MSSERGPDETDGHTGDLQPLGRLLHVPHRAEVGLEIGGRHRHLLGPPLRPPQGDLPADLGDLPLQVSQPGLLGVIRDDGGEGRVLDRQIIRVDTVLGALPGDEIAPGDLQLLLLDVPGKLQDLHAIPERCRDRVKNVGGGDEHDA